MSRALAVGDLFLHHSRSARSLLEATKDTQQWPQLSERLQTPISTTELERRWAAVRAAMEREKIDVLLMQNNNDYMGGTVKYFTDLPATNGYPFTVVFPRDDLMTVVGMGPFGGETDPAANPDGINAASSRADHAELCLLRLHRRL